MLSCELRIGGYWRNDPLAAGFSKMLLAALLASILLSCSARLLHSAETMSLAICESNSYSIAGRSGSDQMLATAACKAKTPAGTVMMGVATRHNTRAMLPLFLGSLRLADNADKHFLLVTSDQLAYEECVLFHHYEGNCILYDLPDRDYSTLDRKKPELAIMLLRLGFAVVNVDIDLIVFQDPIAFVESLPPKDLYLPQEESDINDPLMLFDWRYVDTGFYYIRPSDRAISFLDSWLLLENSVPDKKSLNKLLRGIGQSGVNDTVLSWGLFSEASNINHCTAKFNSKQLHDLEEEFSEVYNRNDRWKELIFIHFPCELPRRAKEAYMSMVMKFGIDRMIADD